MSANQKHLVVVTILEGRYFPRLSNHRLLVETKLDGESMYTDPVEHTSSPFFGTELAWEMDKKSLHQHRMQRTPIKLQCIVEDMSTGARAVAGYMMLDLRMAQKKPQRANWYPLLSTTGFYKKRKPELQLIMTLESESDVNDPGNFVAQPPPKFLHKNQKQYKSGSEMSSASEDEASTKVEPLLTEDGEGFYFQIGPSKKATDRFVLSLSILFAKNLVQLVRLSGQTPSTTGYYFRYYLLDNEITNMIFNDLLNPNFKPERASIRLRSNVEYLMRYFNRNPTIEVDLCCGQQILGMVQIPTRRLIQVSGFEVVEAAFQLAMPNQSSPWESDEIAPLVGVAVYVRKESGLSDNRQAMKANVKTLAVESNNRENDNVLQDKGENPPLKSKEANESNKKESVVDGKDPKSEEKLKDTVYDPNHLESVSNRGSQAAKNTNSGPTTNGPNLDEQNIKRTKSLHDSHRQNLVANKLEQGSHHYRFSIDLRAIRGLNMSFQCNCFMRYTYPYFGSVAPIITAPPITIARNTEVKLPNSYCAFNFACTYQLLQDTTTNIPLTVELWHRDKVGSDMLLGTANLPLADVFNGEKQQISLSTGSVCYRQCIRQTIDIFSTTDAKKVGDLDAILELDDLGEIPTTTPLGSSAHRTSPAARLQKVTNNQTLAPSGSANGDFERYYRETPEYKAALELEIWKEKQKDSFLAELKNREEEYMKLMTQEWKQRDTEREMLVRKKIDEYTKLTEQIKTSIVDLETRERQLTLGERELGHLRNEVKREHELKLAELNEASRRFKEECEHRVTLERVNVRELEDQKEKLLNELKDAERRYKEREAEFENYKDQQSSKPEAQLRADINMLTLEKVELVRKLDATLKSKQHYKEQWSEALKELARLRERERISEKSRLQKQARELEHLRLRYLAQEEKGMMKNDKNELDSLKQEIKSLAVSIRETGSKANEVSKGIKDTERKQTLTAEVDEDELQHHIARLIEERDTLMSTGAYTVDDKVVRELDRKIRDTLARKI